MPEQWAGHPDVMTQPPEAASRAAAFGGVTTIVDFAGDLALTRDPGAARVPIAEAVERRRAVFRGHSYTDFAFHYILAGEVAPETIGEIGEAIQDGTASFKIFTTFRPDPGAATATSGPSSRRWPGAAASWPCTPRRTTSSPT